MNTMTNTSASTVDPGEVERFDAMASEWWSPHGKFRPLHMLNPCRLDVIVEQIKVEFRRLHIVAEPFQGLALLDIGCGGGLLAEPMARLGARVTGIDPAPACIGAARAHADASGLEIDYRCATAEDLAEAGEGFDVILAMEVIEHVSRPEDFLAVCRSLVRPGGMLICSTINRTPASYVKAIIGAEFVLRWLPRGTHDWRRFITPAELDSLLIGAGLDPVDCKGFVFDPFRWSWSVSDSDTRVNYVTTSLRRETGPDGPERD